MNQAGSIEWDGTEARAMMGYPVQFVGAGPGDPELITVKGKRLLEQADRVVYAGSLVPVGLLDHCRPEVVAIDSAPLTLAETHAALVEGYRRGERVVRLHTGDPSLYGAIQEQMRLLAAEAIPYEVVPGVSAAFAAAAALKNQLTLPEISQTVILTRISGRTPVPERERLQDLARHQATLIIYLSVQHLDQVVAELAAHYPPETPVVVAYRVSWPDQKLIRGTLTTIAQAVASQAVTRQAVILVGAVFAEAGAVTRSLLYHEQFSHGYRDAR